MFLARRRCCGASANHDGWRGDAGDECEVDRDLLVLPASVFVFATALSTRSSDNRNAIACERCCLHVLVYVGACIHAWLGVSGLCAWIVYLVCGSTAANNNDGYSPQQRQQQCNSECVCVSTCVFVC